ncbi:PAAR domain-containing protein [Agrobacterium rubi]
MIVPVVCIGDRTSHGGEVIEGFPHADVNGRIPAGVGHQVSCPKCGGTYPIVGPGPGPTLNNIEIAADGMSTACGAKLIAKETDVKLG